jgi:hypothetical protein
LQLRLFEMNDSEDIESNTSTQHSIDNSVLDINPPDDYYKNNYDYESYNTQGQPNTTMSKVQIKLNNLINKHKASLKLYNDIVNLFDEYILSPNFDKHAKLKNRKSLIKSIESSYGVTHLHPRNTEVILHDCSRITVPVFDAKAMILDLISNKNLMNNANIAEVYNAFNGDVDPTNQSNQKYGEVHTCNAWLPTWDRFCAPP